MIEAMPHAENYLPELYYSDDGGVCDADGRFSAWNREIWRFYAASWPALPQTWDEMLVEGRLSPAQLANQGDAR